MQSSFGHHVHTALQELVNIHQEPPERQSCLAGRKCYQQVDIARLVRVTPGHGAEHANVADSAVLGQRADFAPVGFNERVHSQTDSISRRLMKFER